MAKLIKPDEILLSNGIPVILQEYEGTAATTYWWINTGSADERPHEAGFAHFLEHMLFKDAAAKETGRASTGKTAQAIESAGGEINAYTSFDQTVYHVTCAAHQWEQILDSFGVMSRPQKFLKADFDREREVILEELRKNEDSPGRRLFQDLFSSTFAKHPYGRPVIGYTKTLKAASVGTLEAFYKRNYVSSRMGLILVGPIADKRERLIRLLEKHYGSKIIAKRAAPERSRPIEPAYRKDPKFIKRPFDVTTPTISFSFRAPDLKHSDVPALDLLVGVLSLGELSRLYQRLFYASSVVTDVSGGVYIPRDPGMIYFQLELDGMQKIEPATEELFREIKRIATEGPTEDELKRVFTNIESERLYATQTADGLAGRVGFLKFVVGDLDFDREYLEELARVDTKRIQDVAREYFSFERMSGVALVPKAEAKFDIGTIKEKAKAMIGSRGPIQKVVKPKRKEPSFFGMNPEVITMPSGLRLVFQERQHSHVVSAHSAVLGGLRMELADSIDRPEHDWGSSHMMALTWTKGTITKDANAVSKIVEGRAASLDGFSGRNTVGLQMAGLARDWKELSELFSEVLLMPTFPAAEIEHSRRIAEESIRSIEDHTSQLCSKLFLQTLFEKHPYGHITLGSLESLAKIDQTKLSIFHRRWLRPENMVLSVVGNVKKGQLEDWLGRVDEKLLTLGGGQPIPVASLSDEPALKAPRWVEKKMGREQVHIILGGLGTTIRSDDKHALRLLQTLLGGQSGRLFLELREKKSLAYSVSPISFEGLERGYVGTYIACSPDKRDEAVSGISAVMEKIVSSPPSDKEVKRAKEYLLGRRSMDLQSDPALASHYSLEFLYGVPWLREKDFISKINSIGPRDIQKVCQKYFLDQYMVTAAVG